MGTSISFNVELAPEFETGELDTDYFKDVPYLNDAELLALTTFIKKASTGEPLPGKNKPSWLDDNLANLPQTTLYQEYNYWHYHCGPDYGTYTGFSMTHNLQLNLYGSTSSAVIHYSKNSENSITIVGFSPVHIPFPNSDTEANPLFS